MSANNYREAPQKEGKCRTALQKYRKNPKKSAGARSGPSGIHLTADGDLHTTAAESPPGNLPLRVTLREEPRKQ
jgi:hypothetical protein